MRYSNETLRKR